MPQAGSRIMQNMQIMRNMRNMQNIRNMRNMQIMQNTQNIQNTQNMQNMQNMQNISSLFFLSKEQKSKIRIKYQLADLSRPFGLVYFKRYGEIFLADNEIFANTYISTNAESKDVLICAFQVTHTA